MVCECVNNKGKDKYFKQIIQKQIVKNFSIQCVSYLLFKKFKKAIHVAIIKSQSKLHERTKLHEDTFARSHFCTRAQNCTKISLNEGSFLHEDTFARADNFARRQFRTRVIF